MLCNTCTDIRRFKMKVNDARRIYSNIKRLLPDTAIDTSLTNGKCLRKEFEETRGAYFMCGQCMKANKNELLNEEKKITDVIIEFLAYAKNEKDVEAKTSIYQQIQRNLRGNYPKIARNLEQYWFNSVVKSD